MLRPLVLVSIVVGCACMQTRETVERTVMVRTTGSDSHPAATGFIYKKHDDGPESVVKMGASEVLEHLSKLYTKPYASSSAERVIPVNEEEKHEHADGVADVDGIADVDYKKLFNDYSAHYGDNRDYDDYLKNLKHFKGGLYHKYDGDGAEDEGSKKNKNHHYKNGDAGSYHNAKFESYSISGGHDKKLDNDDNRKYYGDSKEDGHNAAQSKVYDAFPSIYDSDDYKKYHEYFGEGDKTFGDAHKYYGAGDRGHDYHHYEPKQHDTKVEHSETGDKSANAEEQGVQHNQQSSEEQSASKETPGDEVAKKGQDDGRSYGYEVKH